MGLSSPFPETWDNGEESQLVTEQLLPWGPPHSFHAPFGLSQMMEEAPSGLDSSFADKDTLLVGLSPGAEPETGSASKQCSWEVAVPRSEDVRGGRAGGIQGA